MEIHSPGLRDTTVVVMHNIIQHIIPHSAPIEPISLVTLTVDGDPYSLFLSWMPPLVPNGEIILYQVYCLESMYMLGSGGMPELFIPDSIADATVPVPGSEQNATVTGLTPFTSYGCYVTAATAIGEGNASATVFQTTDEFCKRMQN